MHGKLIHALLEDEFSSNRSDLRSGNKKFQKNWMSFPEISLYYARKAEISEKFLDEFSRIRQ